MRKLFFLLGLLMSFVSCTKNDQRIVDTKFSENLIYSEIDTDSIESVEIYLLVRDEGFVDDISKLNENQSIGIITGGKISNFFSFRNNIIWTDYNGCLAKRENETYHFMIGNKVKTGFGYFIANVCYIGNRQSMAIRYLYENGETGAAYSDELYVILMKLFRTE